MPGSDIQRLRSHTRDDVGLAEGRVAMTGRSSDGLEHVGPAVGDVFPDVSLPDQTGQVVDLHERRDGRPAIVAFYRSADW